jgi:dTDP-4-amino-4,6-dideoxygalactose transaminase
MNIPFFTLDRQIEENKAAFEDAYQRVLDSGLFIASDVIKQFEREFSKLLEANHPMVSCGNGTDALEIILSTFGIGSGDEVIVPARSWISTSEVVVTSGAKVVFVDVDRFNSNINPNLVKEAVNENTKAVIAVHFYGHPADLDSLTQICEANNLYLIEDCAQAHGATYNGKMIGTFGDAAAFSFFPTKVLGCFGDGGGMVFKKKEHADRARRICNHGQLNVKHQHKLHGRNSRLDAIQASILLFKLSILPELTKKRRALSEIYLEELKGLKGIQLPTEKPGCFHVYYLFVIKAHHRDQLQAYLLERGIHTQLHYPTALPFLDCYQEMQLDPGDFPVASRDQNTILSLPFFPEMTKVEVMEVCKAIKTFYQNGFNFEE